MSPPTSDAGPIHVGSRSLQETFEPNTIKLMPCMPKPPGNAQKNQKLLNVPTDYFDNSVTPRHDDMSSVLPARALEYEFLNADPLSLSLSLLSAYI